MSRIVIDVTSEQHQQIKALAALRGQSIKDFVMDKVISKDDVDVEELHQLLLSRIHESKNTELPNQSFGQLTELLIERKKDK